jgi:hypothetical protein
VKRISKSTRQKIREFAAVNKLPETQVAQLFRMFGAEADDVTLWEPDIPDYIKAGVPEPVFQAVARIIDDVEIAAAAGEATDIFEACDVVREALVKEFSDCRDLWKSSDAKGYEGVWFSDSDLDRRYTYLKQK